MSNKVFLGLDLETSGSELAVGHVPIQLGLAVVRNGRPEVFAEKIGGWHFEGYPEDVTLQDDGRPAVWSGEAAKVHNIPMKEIKFAAPPIAVTSLAIDWIDGLELPAPPDLHIVGWNVAGFDLPFVRKYMRRLDRRISYRTVDLNAITFSLVGSELPGRGTLGYNAVKRMAKDYAAERCAEVYPEAQWHDAGYDALAAVYSLEELRRIVRRVR